MKGKNFKTIQLGLTLLRLAFFAEMGVQLSAAFICLFPETCWGSGQGWLSDSLQELGNWRLALRFPSFLLAGVLKTLLVS